MIHEKTKPQEDPFPRWVTTPFGPLPHDYRPYAQGHQYIIRSHIRANRPLCIIAGILHSIGYPSLRQSQIDRALNNQVNLTARALHVQVEGVWTHISLERTIGAAVMPGDRLVINQQHRIIHTDAICRPQAFSHAINRLLAGNGVAAPHGTCRNCRFFEPCGFTPKAAKDGVGTASNRGLCIKPDGAGIPFRCCYLEGNTDWCHAFQPAPPRA